MSDPKNSETILFVSIPKPHDLCYVEASLMGYQSKLKFSSSYEQHVLNCRQLILAEKEIIASPVIGRAQQVHIIVSRSFFNEGKLQTLLSANNLYTCGYQSRTVTSEIYESCLRYTIITRLSPSWNFVEPYLVQGADFLTNPNTMNAVKMQIVVNENDAHIVMWPQRVKLPPFPLEDYMKLSKNMSKDPSNFFYNFSSINERIFALPRMTQCKLEAISSVLPPKTRYSHLKEFWKEKHGYILPESDASVCYVFVRFFPTAKDMCYPHFCVRQNNLILLPAVDHKSLFESFSCDLSEKLPNICLASQMGYTVPKLNSATEIMLYPNWSPHKQSPKVQDVSTVENWEDQEDVECDSSVNEGEYSDLNTSIQNPLVEIQVEGDQILDINLVDGMSSNDTHFMVNEETLKLLMNSQISLIPTSSFNSPSTANFFTPTTGVLAPINLNDDQLGGKRSAEYSGVSPTEAKKQKSKPQIQENIDVAEYARRGLLGRLNIATLQNFLRQNQVSFKSKEKKSDLIGKIVTILNLPGIPQGVN